MKSYYVKFEYIDSVWRKEEFFFHGNLKSVFRDVLSTVRWYLTQQQATWASADLYDEDWGIYICESGLTETE